MTNTKELTQREAIERLSLILDFEVVTRFREVVTGWGFSMPTGPELVLRMFETGLEFAQKLDAAANAAIAIGATVEQKRDALFAVAHSHADMLAAEYIASLKRPKPAS
jgi:hypothetical protein